MQPISPGIKYIIQYEMKVYIYVYRRTNGLSFEYKIIKVYHLLLSQNPGTIHLTTPC